MRTILTISIFCATILLLPIHPANAAPTVPQIVASAARSLDRQLAARIGAESPVKGVSVIVTTPVDINDFTVSNTLALQIQEEISRWMVENGYLLQEMRKGEHIIFNQKMGEFFLTRNLEELSQAQVTAKIALVSTYTITSQNVRFNMRLLETASLEVVAMSNITIPITPELRTLIYNKSSSTNSSGTAIEPTVITTLP